MKMNRRSFVAALAAAPVAGPAALAAPLGGPAALAAPLGGPAALAAPLGGPLRIPAGFVRGAAVPEGFDFRDPFSAQFMSFGLWYVVDETGLMAANDDSARKGYATPQEAYTEYLNSERMVENECLAEAERKLADPAATDKQRAQARNMKAWALKYLEEIEAALLEPVCPHKFSDADDFGVKPAFDGGKNRWATMVARGDMLYTLAQKYATNPEYGGGPETLESFARAQTDPNWDDQWGGGC